MPEPVDETSGRHTIPVIDRMMDVLGEIERSPGGPTIRELTGALGLAEDVDLPDSQYAPAA